MGAPKLVIRLPQPFAPPPTTTTTTNTIICRLRVLGSQYRWDSSSVCWEHGACTLFLPCCFGAECVSNTRIAADFTTVTAVAV
eukprot:scaffold141789_cov32-Tisochrysis_lutea.AAC.1